MTNKDVHDTLSRMRELHSFTQVHGDEDSPDVERAFAEYRKLLAQMVPIFLPWVQELVGAGLLTLSMELGDKTDREGMEFSDLTDFTGINANCTAAFDNGSIWLEGEWGGEGGLTKEASQRIRRSWPRPCGGLRDDLAP